MPSKKITSNALNSAAALTIFGVLLGATFSASSWAMDEADKQDSHFISVSPKTDLSSPMGDLQKFSQFQKNVFLRFTEEWKKKAKEYFQMILDELSQSDQAHPENKIFITYQTIEGMREVKEIFTKTPASPNIHHVVFLDLDETLFFSGPNGWLDCCFNKELTVKKEHIFQLFLKYGFSSKTEFDSWGNLKFPVPITKVGPNYKFYDQPHVLDPDIPQILKNWHGQKVDIFGLTSRNSLCCTYTKESLEAAEIHMQKLSRIQIEETDVLIDFTQCIESGVIYTSAKNKFGQNRDEFAQNSAGLKFLGVYLGKLFTKTPHPQNLEIIVVDNNKEVFSELISKSNINEVKRLEEKFNAQIRFKFFQPIEERWLAPQYNDIWNRIDPTIREGAVFKALQKFLATFCEPLNKPLPGPFQMD